MTNRIRVFLDSLTARALSSVADGISPEPPHNNFALPGELIHFADGMPAPFAMHEIVTDEMHVKKDALYTSERALVEQINERMERLWSVRRSIRAVEAGIEQMGRPFDKPKPLALLAPPEPKRQSQEA